MPVYHMKSPEIAKADQEAENQAHHEAWLRDQIMRDTPENGDWQAVGVVLGGILICALTLRVVFYLVLGF